MKTLKTNLFENIFKAASLLLCATLMACSGLSGVSGDDGGASSSSSVRGAYLSAIEIGSGRSIMPVAGFNLMSDIAKYTLECAQQGEGSNLASDNREWTTDTESETSAYNVMISDITENKIPLVEGTTWQFTIKAYKLSTDTNPVLEKTVTQDIVSGNNTIRFGYLDESAGSGSLEILLNFPSNAGVTRVVASLKNVVTGNSVATQTYTSFDTPNENQRNICFVANPEHGSYIVDFTFTMVNGQTTTQVVSDFVRIATGLRSAAQITINDLNSVYTVAYYPNGVDMPAGKVWPRTYSPLDVAITLPTLTKKGARFVGWYESSNYGGSPVTTIAGGARGNKTLYVKWDYEMTGNTISACGAHVIIQASNGKTYCYFDANENGTAEADEVVRAENDGEPLDITGYTVYGGSEGGSYSGATYVTVNSGSLNAVFGGNGTGTVTNTNVQIKGGTINAVYGGSESGSVSGTATVSVSSGTINTVYGGGSESTSSTKKAVITVSGGSVDYVFAGPDGGSVQNAELAISGGTVGYVYGGGKNGTVTGNTAMAISGGTVTNVDGGKSNNKVGGTSSLVVSGTPKIGSSSAKKGVLLTSVTGEKILASNLDSAQASAITLVADHSHVTEGTVVATFTSGTASAGKFSLVRDNDGRTVNVNVDGDNIVTIGNFDLPDPEQVTWTGSDEFTLGTGNITTGGTIFSVFADGGFLTVESTTLEGAVFDMGIPLDANYKENGYDDASSFSTSKNYRYIQFTSATGSISPTNADIYLSKIHFHTIRGASVKVRINLETVSLASINTSGVTYLDGSYYKAVKGHMTWSDAYNAAKQWTFNGLTGYLMTITSDAENKFIYDQLFEKKGIQQNDASAWLGASRSINQSGSYDGDTWSVSTSALNNYWTWVCGPEAGKMFYTKKTTSAGGTAAPIEGTDKTWYASWNNGEPNNSPNDTNPEYCAQYCQKYKWNDLSNVGNTTSETSQYYVKYYVVEFTPYEATAYGPGQRADQTALHAERTYSK